MVWSIWSEYSGYRESRFRWSFAACQRSTSFAIMCVPPDGSSQGGDHSNLRFDAGAFSPSMGFPALDTIPDTNSSLVQQWIKEVQSSGVKIPDLVQSVEGGCEANPGLVANTSRCWWTCGGCTRDTDITTCPDKVRCPLLPRGLFLTSFPQMTWGLSYDDGPSPYSTGQCVLRRGNGTD